MRLNNKLLAFACIVCLTACKQSPPQVKTAYNQQATPPALNGFSPVKDHVLNVLVDTAAGTTSLLYGNGTAFQHARQYTSAPYPTGSVLSLVTWKQAPDPRWIGGNIPDNLLKIEMVTFSDSTVYQCYEGKPLTKVIHPDAEDDKKRIIAIKAFILP